MMDKHKLTITLLIMFITFGCSPAAVAPSGQASLTEVKFTSTIPPTPSMTVAPSVTLDSDFPEGCTDLTETPLDTGELNGLLVVADSTNFPDYYAYFLDPKSNQLIDIEKQIPLSWDAPDTDVNWFKVSPNKKFIQAHLTGKDYDILSTVDEIINTYSTQGQEDWNRGRWLDKERMVFQYWSDAPYGSYRIVIYNPFTGEQKDMQIDLPNPYIEKDIGGRITWVKADIAPSLKRVLYNDKDENLVLWDLDSQKEITSLPSPIDVTDGTWSPDGNKFAIPWLSPSYDPTEYFIIDMDGKVKKTSFNQEYPFANVERRPEWSPDGRYIAFQLEVSNIANPNLDDLRQEVAIMDTTTLDTQIYCLSGGIVWSPDSTHVIINAHDSSEDVEPVLVDLTHQTRTTLDTHGLPIADWLVP